MRLFLSSNYLGNWSSQESITRTEAGEDFFLSISVRQDGTFSGFWDNYVWISIPIPGPYFTIDVQGGGRANAPAMASGMIDFDNRKGHIILEKLGRTNFVLASSEVNQAEIQLPPNWLSRPENILFKSTLFKK